MAATWKGFEFPEPRLGAWPGASPPAFRPVVTLDSVAYRVTRLQRDEYEIVRIVDDRRLATFRSVPAFEVTSAVVSPALARRIAALAAQAKRKTLAQRISSALRGGARARPGAFRGA